MPPGRGALDAGGVRRALEASGYEGTVTVEHEGSEPTAATQLLLEHGRRQARRSSVPRSRLSHSRLNAPLPQLPSIQPLPSGGLPPEPVSLTVGGKQRLESRLERVEVADRDEPASASLVDVLAVRLEVAADERPCGSRGAFGGLGVPRLTGGAQTTAAVAYQNGSSDSTGVHSTMPWWPSPRILISQRSR